MNREIFQFKQESEDNTDILIYGDIAAAGLWEQIFGDDPTRTGAFDFATALAAVETPNITVRINSYGGSVSEALAIYNQLKGCGKNITTICDGFACSAASVIYCAGAKRIMPKTSLLMIHNAWSYGGEGNANYFRKLADDLEKITQPSIEAYKEVSNLSEERIKELMDAETWITADEALEWGFATEEQTDDANQSLEHGYVLDMVLKMKNLEKELETAKTREPEKADPWKSYFHEV